MKHGKFPKGVRVAQVRPRAGAWIETAKKASICICPGSPSCGGVD